MQAARKKQYAVRRLYEHIRVSFSADMLKTYWEAYLAAQRSSAVSAFSLLTPSSSLDDYLGDVISCWDAKLGRQRYSCYPGNSLPPVLAAAINAEMWRVLKDVREPFLRDPRLEMLCSFAGVDLFSFLKPFLAQSLVNELPELLHVAHHGRAYYAGFKNAVLLFGGITHGHFVLARAARREGIPVVSSHKGGFLGYAYLPMHERYDLAECDYFHCNGPGAVATFQQSHPEACWNPETPRAVPATLCATWAASAAPEVALPDNKRRRVMLVMPAFLGDNCYMGYVFSPEKKYGNWPARILRWILFSNRLCANGVPSCKVLSWILSGRIPDHGYPFRTTPHCPNYLTRPIFSLWTAQALQ
jgi:hypothetical protein